MRAHERPLESDATYLKSELCCKMSVNVGFAQVDGDHFASDVRRHGRQQMGQRGAYACADIQDVLRHGDFRLLHRLLHRPAAAAC
jgi:hypothetical protein